MAASVASPELPNPLENDLSLLLQNKALDICFEKGKDEKLGTENSSHKAALMRSVFYIVCGVVINENDEVLMMQEAKSSCRGTWYLPAGRMEPNESIAEAAQREVLEETGLRFEPSTLLSVESQGSHWFRFTFTGGVTGGTLKTLENADKESLQAAWIPRREVATLNLRHSDILPLIEIASRRKSLTVPPPDRLPINNAHQQVLLRFLLLHLDNKGEMHVVKATRGSPHLPVERHFQGLLDVFGDCTEVDKLDILGIVSLEHCGKHNQDGLCLTCLCTLNSDGLLQMAPQYEWHQVTQASLRENLQQTIKHTLLIPFIQHGHSVLPSKMNAVRQLQKLGLTKE